MTNDQRAVCEFAEDGVRALVAGANGRIRERTLHERKDFLDSIESQPLTAEQAAAVVTMNNRVRVVAAAGSGKTEVPAGPIVVVAGVGPDADHAAAKAYGVEVARGDVAPDGLHRQTEDVCCLGQRDEWRWRLRRWLLLGSPRPTRSTA